MPKLAVVGAGPAGFYTALRVLQKLPHASIDFFEKQPVPFGLSRFGVAPDHPEVKNCEERFAEVAAAPTVRFFGNTAVGADVSLRALRENYNAVLLAYGAPAQRRLGVPGAGLPGVLSARDFVAWYNGEPAAQALDPALARAERVAIVGNGNVALDVARLLLMPVDDLRHTDITEQALAALAASRVRHVDIVARRGLLEAAFTNKELRELLRVPGVTLQAPADVAPLVAGAKLGRAEKRRVQLLQEAVDAAATAKAEVRAGGRTVALTFLRSPRAFHASAQDPALLRAVEWDETRLEAGRAVATGAAVETPADLALTSIGYAGAALPGMAEAGVAFDAARARVAERAGRVPDTNVFVAGWARTGATGVIATTMMDAFSVGEEIAGYLGDPAHAALRAGAAGAGVPAAAVSWEDWERLDAAERAAGAPRGKPREKFTSVAAMLAVIKQGAAA